MSEIAIPSFLRGALTSLNVALSDEQLERLRHYLALLLEANRRVNLTAVRDPDAAWRRLVLDSLTLAPGLEPLGEGATLIDVGSGGGIPGIPLAIARPDVRVTLLEATGKKTRFLEQCAATLSLANVSVVNDRAEHVGQDKRHRQQYDLATARAVGSVAEVLEYTLPLVKVGGRVLALKGRAGERELAEASDALATLGAGEVQVFEAYPEPIGHADDTPEAAGASEDDEALLILSIVKERPTPRAYPRRPGLPRQQPL